MILTKKEIKRWQEYATGFFEQKPKEVKMQEMTKQEALAQIERLKRYVERKGREVVLGSSVIIAAETQFNSKGICFNGGLQKLVISHGTGAYGVTSKEGGFNTVTCKAIPCHKSELNAGDLAYRFFSIRPSFDSSTLLCLMLDSKKYVFVEDGEIKKGDTDSDKYWHKIIEV